METTEGDTDLCDKNWKKHIQVESSIGYIVTQKKGAKGRGSFLLYIDLGCILLSAYTCEIYLWNRSATDSLSIKLCEIRESQDSRLQKKKSCLVIMGYLRKTDPNVLGLVVCIQITGGGWWLRRSFSRNISVTFLFLETCGLGGIFFTIGYFTKEAQWLKILWGIKRTSYTSALQTSEYLAILSSPKSEANISRQIVGPQHAKSQHTSWKWWSGNDPLLLGYGEFPGLILWRLFDTTWRKTSTLIFSHCIIHRTCSSVAPAKVYLPFQWDRWSPFPTCGKSIWQK